MKPCTAMALLLLGLMFKLVLATTSPFFVDYLTFCDVTDLQCPSDSGVTTYSSYHGGTSSPYSFGPNERPLFVAEMHVISVGGLFILLGCTRIRFVLTLM